MDAGVIIAVISGLVGLASAAYTARSASRTSVAKTEADERVALRQIEAGAYERARQVYEGTLGRMQSEIDRQAAQINTLQRQVSRLSRQVRDAGLVPATSSEDDT
ncbi:hypothetical protein AB0L53_54775 [Nonomuraea sp. NPDC052129]|uniref:hypothetical protein n=1 Tax=Nonomuraea sp. NPDC052129 TaxID=3154651 RepID=UPI003444C218